MSSFHEIQINDAISLNSRVEIMRSTQVAEAASGDEDRNAQWRHSRRRADIGYAAREKGTITDIVDFFEARNGRLAGFRFRDWSDWKVTDEPIATADGEARVFQLIRRITSGRQVYLRPIIKPVYGTVIVKLDGVTHADAVVNHSDGTIWLADPPASGVVVTADFEFDLAMRFENDTLPTTIITCDVMGAPDIPLIELRRGEPDDDETLAYNFPDDLASIWTDIAIALEGASA